MKKMLLVIISLISVLFSADIYKDVGTDLVWQDTKDNIKIKKTWYGAYKYCKNLDLEGSKNWILPTKDMFSSIVDMKNRPTIKSDFKYIGENYWTSNCIALRHGKSKDYCVEKGGVLSDNGYSLNPMYITFLTGDTNEMMPEAKMNVRCVQKPYVLDDDFIPHTLYRDSDTSLIWADTSSVTINGKLLLKRTGTFEESKTYCKELVVSDKSSEKINKWRLPSIKELKTLIGKTKRFKNLKKRAYWSNTLSKDKKSIEVMPLLIENAFVFEIDKSAKDINFMCVKDFKIKK
jgi:hypothetical protein